MSDYTPKPENKFTFGLWTVGNVGRDPFGGPVREAKSPAEAERDGILKDSKKALLYSIYNSKCESGNG
jgi:hypothetical protein